MKSKNTITVIVLAFYGDQWIPSCIETLRQASEKRIRLLLVDNAGNSCISHLDLSDFDATILQCEKPLGFAEANNFAMVNGGLETDFVCFLNQDTLSEEGWLDACVQCLSNNPDIGAITPLVTTYDWQGWDSNFLECAYLSGDFRQDHEANRPLRSWYDVPQVQAAAMVVRTSALKKVGPFDPIYGTYCEDYDLCARIRNAGYHVGICTTGCIRHFSGSASTSTSRLRRKARQTIRNRLILGSRRRPRGRAIWVMNQLTVVMVRRLLRSFARRPGSQPCLSVLSSWFDVLVLLPRLISARTDASAFRRDLARIGWPTSSKEIAGSVDRPRVFG